MLGVEMNAGILLIRVVVGLLIAAIGSKKLFGWFGGDSLERVGLWFASMGFTPGKVMAIMTGTIEAGAGVALVVGFLTPFASAALCGTLVVALQTQLRAGFWARTGGIELPLLYATAAAAIGLTGAGKYSVDAALEIPHTADTAVAGVAIGAAIIAAGAVIMYSRSRLNRLAATNA